MIIGSFLVLVLLELLACKAYFHTALPLSFYMKSRHAYEGYHEVWHPELMMFAFLAGCELYLAVLILLARKQDWRLIVCCITPALAVFAYLGTVTQIMGFNARYYTPYFAFFVVPALLVLDRWLTSEDLNAAEQWPRRTLLVRSCAVALMMLCFLGLSSESVQATVRRLEAGTHFEYEPAHLDIAASSPLPGQPWDVAMRDITDLLMAPLPRGATVAATEVGYLGDRAPQINVIDLAGLNDTDIALHGFDVAALLLRKPDIIWMPNASYTYQRGVMFADPRFLAQYDVYAGAANYGIAIRKDSPIRPQIDRQMQLYWSVVYPGYRMNDYLVRTASWSGRKFKVVGD
jgi:putative Ca2+/H+ antiporter (TMEM165/GDT1 family)